LYNPAAKATLLSTFRSCLDHQSTDGETLPEYDFSTYGPDDGSIAGYTVAGEVAAGVAGAVVGEKRQCGDPAFLRNGIWPATSGSGTVSGGDADATSADGVEDDELITVGSFDSSFDASAVQSIMSDAERDTAAVDADSVDADSVDADTIDADTYYVNAPDTMSGADVSQDYYQVAAAAGYLIDDDGEGERGDDDQSVDDDVYTIKSKTQDEDALSDENNLSTSSYPEEDAHGSVSVMLTGRSGTVKNADEEEDDEDAEGVDYTSVEGFAEALQNITAGDVVGDIAGNKRSAADAVMETKLSEVVGGSSISMVNLEAFFAEQRATDVAAAAAADPEVDVEVAEASFGSVVSIVSSSSSDTSSSYEEAADEPEVVGAAQLADQLDKILVGYDDFGEPLAEKQKGLGNTSGSGSGSGSGSSAPSTSLPSSMLPLEPPLVITSSPSFSAATSATAVPSLSPVLAKMEEMAALMHLQPGLSAQKVELDALAIDGTSGSGSGSGGGSGKGNIKPVPLTPLSSPAPPSLQPSSFDGESDASYGDVSYGDISDGGVSYGDVSYGDASYGDASYTNAATASYSDASDVADGEGAQGSVASGEQEGGEGVVWDANGAGVLNADGVVKATKADAEWWVVGSAAGPPASAATETKGADKGTDTDASGALQMKQVPVHITSAPSAVGWLVTLALCGVCCAFVVMLYEKRRRLGPLELQPQVPPQLRHQVQHDRIACLQPLHAAGLVEAL
jgi:hypothetical protein